MASNSPSVPEGSMAGTDPKAELLGAGAGDKPAHEENSTAAYVEHLIQSRKDTLKEKQMARRAAWEEEVKAEVAARDRYLLSMEGLTRRQVTSLEDQEALSRISISWRKGLDKERTKFLFHQVFPIISRRQKTPFHIHFKEIDNLRQVSRLYKDVIDHTLSTTSTHFHELSLGIDRARQNEYSFLQFKSVDPIRVFNRKSVFEYRGSNPFPFRQLYLGNIDTILGGSSLVYWIELEKLLTHWGHEVWTVFYAFEIGCVELMYEFLIKYLNLMPNLRELAIIGKDCTFRRHKQVECPLIRRIREKPLPTLSNLHSITFVNFTPGSLIEAMLDKYGGTLRSLSINGRRGFDKHSGKYLDFGGIVAGRELQLTNYACMYINSSQMSHWNYQLPALDQLRIDNFNLPGGWELSNIFKTVNSCGASLRRLELRIHFNKENQRWRHLPLVIQLELPQLERLDLNVERSEVTNFDFLLPLVSLKEFHLFYSLPMDCESTAEQQGGLIQFGEGYIGSNFWTLLPELRLFTISALVIDEHHRMITELNRDDYREEIQKEQERK